MNTAKDRASLALETSSANILLVEDNEDDFVLVEAYLPRPEFTVTWCPTAGAAWDELALGACDLVLLDHVPMLAITANALKGDAEKALAAGCDAYMSKPINIHELRARVDAFVTTPQPD